MGRIVAIAGGDLTSTEPVNKFSIQLSGKKQPHLLFIGTASQDASDYIARISAHFSQLGCIVDTLSLTRETYNQTQIDEKLAWADIIYVGGGDTVAMMNIWKQNMLDQKLIEIYRLDRAVLTGISAGALCWFQCGHSDSESFSGKSDWNYIFAEHMLDLHHFAFCPHYNEPGRDSFDHMLKEKDVPGLAMENETAFVEVDGKISFVRSREDACAYKIEYRNNQMIKEAVALENIS